MKHLKTFEQFSQEFDQNIDETNENLLSIGNRARKEDLENSYIGTASLWAKKGIEKLTQAEYEAEIKKAALDKFEGKWGISPESKIAYIPKFAH